MVSPIGTKASEEQCYMGTYHSTRGRTLSCSSKVAIRTGIAPDGGLFVSDELGTQQVDISSLADKSYFEIAQDVLGMLLNDYTAEEISACVDEAYRGTFASEEVTPLVKLDAAPGADAPQTYVMELFGGPTSAFKDVALQMLPRLMARTSAKDGGAERIMIVTATSGDTGKAALAGFADAPGTGITVFYPEGKVSRVQNLQMSTQEGDNVAVCGIRGNFDDAQSAALAFHTEKLNTAKVLGCVLGFAGVALVNLSGADGTFGFTLDGEGFILASTVAGALSTCLIGIFSREHDGVLLAGWQFLVGGLVLTAIGFLMGGALSPTAIAPAIALIIYMALISAVAYSLWSRLLAVNPVSRVSVFGFMNPVFGVLLSALLLGEGAGTSPATVIVALLLVCGGIIIVNKPKKA